MGPLWLFLLPLVGPWWAPVVAFAVVAAADIFVKALRQRWLCHVNITSDPGDRGRRLLAIADQVDHATLWQACTDPDAELASYHHEQSPGPKVSGGRYEQPPYFTTNDRPASDVASSVR